MIFHQIIIYTKYIMWQYSWAREGERLQLAIQLRPPTFINEYRELFIAFMPLILVVVILVVEVILAAFFVSFTLTPEKLNQALS